ncbi:MAG: MarR family transcriptional regulator [Chloroflexi bacterium]|nr:MarR family transcriptional regulator [Chloroflexota bacterium]
MAAKGELVARIAELSESLAAKSQPKPEDLATETNLTLPQIRILYFLSRGPKRITEVSRAHGVALPNASNMVERLVKKGLVQRVPDPNDRRVALACLTNEGRQVIEAMARSNFVVVENLTMALSIAELEVVVRALEILNRGADHLEAVNDDAVAVPGVGTRESAPD